MGIYAIFNFTAKVDCLAEATAYLGFTSTRALETFVDTVGRAASTLSRHHIPPSVVRGSVGPENFESVANMSDHPGGAEADRIWQGQHGHSSRTPQGPTEAARALRRQAMRAGSVERMYSTELPIHKHLEEKNAESVVPPISFEQIDGLLAQVASSFMFRSTPVQAEVAGTIVYTTARQEFISQAMAEQDDADAAAVAQSLARSSVISMLGDCAGELAEAVDIVGMDDWRRLAPDPSRLDFTLKLHQLVDAVWMAREKASLVPATILANDVGTGKTFTYLMAIHVGAICKSRKETAVYRPTLLIAPNKTIDQVVKEATRTFQRFSHYQGVLRVPRRLQRPFPAHVHARPRRLWELYGLAHGGLLHNHGRACLYRSRSG